MVALTAEMMVYWKAVSWVALKAVMKASIKVDSMVEMRAAM